MKKHLFFCLLLIFIPPATALLAVDDCHWENIRTLDSLLANVPELSKRENRKESNELNQVEKCLKDEARRLNERWIGTHDNLVQELNAAWEKLTRLERLEAEIGQYQKAVRIQEQSIQSLKLIFQNKLMGIPKAYVVYAHAFRDEKTPDRVLARRLREKSRQQLQSLYSDHQIGSDSTVRDYPLVRDVIEIFQGGHVQSHELDPIIFIDEDENLHYLQVYLLYPMFPFRSLSTLGVGQQTSSPQITAGRDVHLIESATSKELNPLFRDVFQKKLSRKLEIRGQINASTMAELKSESQSYDRKIGPRNQLLKELKSQLEKFRASLMSGSNIESARSELRKIQQQFNEHVKEREFIVVTNTSELGQGASRLTEQYRNVVSRAWKDLNQRANSLKSFKFFQVVNYELQESDSARYYGEFIVLQSSMPFFRRTFYRDQATEHLGIVLGLRIKFVQAAGLTQKRSADGRFIDLGNHVIKDTKTGLFWTRKDSFADLGKCLNWNDSREYVASLTTGEYSNWRMPTAKELEGIYESSKRIMDHAGDASRLDPVFAPKGAWWYWISDTTDSCCAHTVSFFNGYVGESNRTTCKNGGVRAVHR